MDLYNNICDLTTFLNSFPKFELIEVHETPQYLIKALFDDYNTRKLAETFNKIRTLLIDGKVSEAMTLYQTAQEGLSSGVSLQCVDIVKDTSRYDDYVERTKDFNKYYISTGFKELDSIVGGFDREEELATIVARTNMGKTWLLLKCALSAAQQGLRVGIYSGEMSERKVGYRIDTLLGHISNGSITHGNDNVLLDYKKYIDELPSLIKGSIKVLTPKMINGPADVNSLRVFIEKENLQALFVDQFSLLEDQRKGKSPTEKMSNISKDLKNLQVLKRIPIISVSQQNRTVVEDGANTTQIAQSDRIGQDSTMIIFMEKKDNLIKLILVKSRDSENSKTLSYVVDFNLGTFTYVPDETSEVSQEVSSVDEYKTRYDVVESEEDVF
jgi:replicative DNA helicase